ncbi:MAG: hypothetical protein U0802_18045 [Candidatus Binatia bacterium]
MIAGVVAGLLLAEWSVRALKWTPPAQIVRGYGLHAVDGVPVWEQDADRQNTGCVEAHPERTRILFFGSSITFGVGLEAAEVFTAALQQRLDAARSVPGFCVLNFAQPGFAFQQKYAVARAAVARYRPALILWEDWVEWPEYRLIGDAAYRVDDLRLRADGYVDLAGVPDGLNRVLFRHSRLYEYLALTFGERVPRPPGPWGLPAFFDTHLAEVVQLAQSVGARLVFYLAPPLDQPFPVTDATPPDWHGLILDFARRHDVAAYRLQHELVDYDYLALRLDPCCHFNAAGHRALAPVMERIVREQLDLPG